MQKCCDKCIELDPVFNDKCQAGCYQKVFSNDYFWAWLYRKWQLKPEVENNKLFLYKSINVYWPNGLAPTQYTDFDFYSSTSGNYTNWFGSEIFCFIFWLANENTRIGKLFSSNFIGQLSSQWRHLVFAAYFCSQPLISASTFSPAWSLFSRPTMKLTPSTTIWTNESSEKPRRSALEISNIPPSEAVSTPP